MSPHQLSKRSTTLFSVTALAIALAAGLPTTVVLAQNDPHAGHDHSMHMAQQQAEKTYATSGTIKSLQPEKKRAMIEHDAIPELKWPVMTMPFEVPDATLMGNLKAGECMDFTFKINADGRSVLLTAKPKA